VPPRRLGEARPGQRFRGILLVHDKRLQTARTGNPYLALTVGDRSGRLAARVWDEAEAYARRFQAGDFIFVDGVIDAFRGRPQLRVSHLEQVSDSAVRTEDFLPASDFDSEEMLGELRELVRGEVGAVPIRRLLLEVLSDSELVEALVRSPAAKGNHHAYLAGLLEHSLSMTRLAVSVADHYAVQYPGLLDKDLLIAGAILHDIGKIWELTARRQIDYTDAGRLIGHIVLGVELITRILARLDIRDVELSLRLKHMILSHHGELEYGAVVKPQTPEAQVLHYLDQIDARLNMFAGAIDEADGPWSAYQRPLGRQVYAGSDPTVRAGDHPTSSAAPSPATNGDPPDRSSAPTQLVRPPRGAGGPTPGPSPSAPRSSQTPSSFEPPPASEGEPPHLSTWDGDERPIPDELLTGGGAIGPEPPPPGPEAVPPWAGDDSGRAGLGTEPRDQPADKTSKPADQAPKPADKTSKPADQAPKPADQAPQPADKTSKPADQAPKPADQAPQPADKTSKPADQAPKPAASPARAEAPVAEVEVCELTLDLFGPASS
jgi:3'-5' exoribonuclease